jgi:hypothetical protein
MDTTRQRFNILDFIKHNTAGLIDAEQADSGRNQRHQHEQFVVGGGEVENVIVSHTV